MSSTDTPPEQPLLGKDHQLLPPIPIQNTPRFAIPTIALGLIAAFIWWSAASGFWTASLPVSTTIAACAIASFLMFTVLHEAAHGSVSSIPWVNSLIGRFAMLLVAGYGSFSMYRYAHESHHWHTNESDGFDPDFWVLDGPSWQRPIRMATVDLGYLLFYIRNYAHRPRNEVGETFFILLTSVMLIIWLADAGHLWTLAVCYLIPQRIALLALAWWFDWLPHNGLTGTAKTDRFQATRNRIGMDWVFTPLMLGQNYHLAHHINPAVPFYRLSSVWARHAADYRVWNPATSTWNGRRVDCGSEPCADAEEKVANIGSLDRSTFYPLTVQKVYRLTADSATVTFDVPADLAEKFAFRQGQHITIKCDLGGEGVRRNYSICSSTVSGELRIAVKHIPGGAFSTHVLEKVKAGDVFDVMPPSGRFFTPLDAAKAKTYVGIAGGSGITPIFSILSSTLEVEQESRFILLYANKDVDSIMFRDELRELRQAYPNRFQLLHFLSREPQIANYLQGSIERESYSTELPDSLIRGHLDRYKLAGLMNSYVSVKHVDDWFLCGPEGLVDELSNTLEYHGVDEENIHKELFVSGTGRKPGSQSKQQRSDDAVSSSISVACQGEITEFDMEQGGEFVLDAAMRDRDDLPYACQSGACGTCRARVTEGSVEMEVNMALENDELEAGYVLTCQARPTSSRVVLDFDQ
jgi:ring-1,2-phenylacetyl-CoA epoxidase subunit PaaE